MLSGVSHQQVMAIALIVVFGIQFCFALGYLLCKKVGSPASLARRLLAGAGRRRESRRLRAAIGYGFSAGDARSAGAVTTPEPPESPEPPGPPENTETKLAGITTIVEQIRDLVVEKFAETNSALEGVDTKVSEASTKVDGVGSDVRDIRKQLTDAGRTAFRWNISSLVFGAAGVIIGILAL
jgi:hypothetical protein